MPRVSISESALVEQLHHLVFSDSEIRDILKLGFKSALTVFDDPDYSLPYASYNVSISHFTSRLTEEQKAMIGLCRVFILRAGCKMPIPEIHRNSIQRLVSFKGAGAIVSATQGGMDMTFTKCAIMSPNKNRLSPLEQCWDIVPENTWHYPIADSQEDWFTVTFHSASESEIIDEYWKPNENRPD